MGWLAPSSESLTAESSFAGHFSALVPSEPYQRLDSAREEEEDVTFLPLMDCENKLIPIHFLSQAEVSCSMIYALFRRGMEMRISRTVSVAWCCQSSLKILNPINRFRNQYRKTFVIILSNEMFSLINIQMGHEETIMRQWLDVCFTEGGLMVAQQKLHKRPLLVAQMLEEWLNHYRRIAWVSTPSTPPTHFPCLHLHANKPAHDIKITFIYFTDKSSHLHSAVHKWLDWPATYLMATQMKSNQSAVCWTFRFLTRRPLPPKKV